MKTLILLLFLAAGWQLGAQNLITNPSFDQGDLEINCSDWYNGCGEPLSLHCTENGYCMVHFVQDTPSMIPENRWAAALTAGFPQGKITYHVTGLNGTLVLRLEFWMRAQNLTSMGIVSLGKTVNGQYTESHSYLDTATAWRQLSTQDTITLSASDSLTLTISASMGDFIFEEIVVDDIWLEVMETLGISEAVREKFKISYDAGTDLLRVQSKDSLPFDIKLLDLNGREIKQGNSAGEQELNLEALKDGLYFLQIETGKGGFSEKIIKY